MKTKCLGEAAALVSLQEDQFGLISVAELLAKISIIGRVPSVGRMARVFVYGTLKKGQPNYQRMINGTHGIAKFQGRGHTVEKYPLVIAGKYNIPYLLNMPGTGRHVAGEIYTVDDQMLQFLDEFEGCPDMYQRTPVRIAVVEWKGKSSTPEERPAVNSIMECFVYSTTTFQPEWVNLPYYDNYDSLGKHGLCYVLRESRD
ncbi:gamma-glutamylaminecyclotransferase isoform X1 [Alligator mississippiensis]|uniref:gamma-glutamylaminecyclotransferase isoform X1 n=2 Tax=Alligator mississippiensis TaxID=8496 RepID=UPI00287754A5|nr:gamma-glutamylaminecyclotransferase isoform X1 [Alligator mississippiensis]